MEIRSRSSFVFVVIAIACYSQPTRTRSRFALFRARNWASPCVSSLFVMCGRLRRCWGREKSAERADKASASRSTSTTEEHGRRRRKLPRQSFFFLLTPITQPKTRETKIATDLLASALDHATDVDARVRPIISNLKGIKKALDRLGHAKAASTEEVQHYQQMLAAIDARRADGVFAGSLADVPAGQAQAVELLEQAFERAHALLEGATDMDSHLKVEVFEPLVKHKRRE